MSSTARLIRHCKLHLQNTVFINKVHGVHCIDKQNMYEVILHAINSLIDQY